MDPTGILTNAIGGILTGVVLATPAGVVWLWRRIRVRLRARRLKRRRPVARVVRSRSRRGQLDLFDERDAA
jgi:hypothetical protein